MGDAKLSGERDPSNPTFNPGLSDIYAGGGVSTFQRKKYAPILKTIHSHKYAKRRESYKLLDVGVGYGAFLKLCQERSLGLLHGMDPFPGSIEIAQRYTLARMVEGRIENDPWPVSSFGPFDAITCLDVVEHLPDPSLFFKRAKTVMASGAIYIVRTPLGGPAYDMRSLPLIGDKDENPTHINIHPPRYWKSLASKHGYRILKCWKGEHLSHLKPVEWLGGAMDRAGLDHRRMFGLSEFEQAFVMVLSTKK